MAQRQFAGEAPAALGVSIPGRAMKAGLLEVADVVVDQHFMLQKEVVDRMAAAPGGKDYGRLSVMLQWRYDIENLFEVPPEAFDPPPKVDSAVVRMTPLAEPPQVDAGVLETLVAVAFSQRRKILRSMPLYQRAIQTGMPFPKPRRVVFEGNQPASLPGWVMLEVG